MTYCGVGNTTEAAKGTMVLQVLDLVTPSGEPFYGDCPVPSYTNLDINTTGHTTCTVLPQGEDFLNFFRKFAIHLNVHCFQMKAHFFLRPKELAPSLIIRIYLCI